jgi:hypothetical protein
MNMRINDVYHVTETFVATIINKNASNTFNCVVANKGE